MLFLHVVYALDYKCRLAVFSDIHPGYLTIYHGRKGKIPSHLTNVVLGLIVHFGSWLHSSDFIHCTFAPFLNLIFFIRPRLQDTFAILVYRLTQPRAIPFYYMKPQPLPPITHTLTAKSNPTWDYMKYIYLQYPPPQKKSQLNAKITH